MHRTPHRPRSEAEREGRCELGLRACPDCTKGASKHGLHEATVKLKEPGLQSGSFNFQGEEKSPYEGNCIISRRSLLDGSPTPP